MHPRHRLVLASFLLLGTFLAGCGNKAASKREEGGKGERVAFISNNAFDFWLIARAGTEKAAQELGVTVDFRMPAQGTAVEQRQIIEDLMTSGVRHFAVSVNDAMNQGPFYDDLIKQGAVVITQDTDLPAGSKRLCYIGTDNFKAGLAAGELVKKGQPAGGKVAIFVGSVDKLNAIERRNGVVAALAGLKTNDEANQLVAKGYPITAGKYTVLATLTDDGDEPKCKANAEDLMTKNPDLACLVGLYAYNPPQLLLAVKDQKKLGQVKIVAFDENRETLQGIREGHIVGTVVQQPFEFGYQSVKTLARMARGDKAAVPTSGVIHIDHEVIEKGNVDAFETKLKTLLKK